MENSSQRFVAFVDLLGFKELIKSHQTSDVVLLYQNMLSKVAELLDQFDSSNPSVPEGKKFSGIVHSVIISDSIVFWTDHDDHVCFMNLVRTIRILFAVSLNLGLPLRGSITFDELWDGEFSLSSNSRYSHTSHLLIGRALVKAYEIEGKQQWHGCIIDESAFSQFQKSYEEVGKILPGHNYSFDEIVKISSIVLYPVPFNDGPIRNCFVIDWTFDKWNAPNMQAIEIELRRLFGLHHKPENIANWRVEQKIRNTLQFMFLAMQFKNTKIMDDKLNKYIEESTKALSILNQNRETKIEDLELQKALAKVLGLSDDNSTSVYQHDLTSEEMLTMLESHDFSTPTILTSLSFENSILPKDIPKRIDEKQVKVKGEIWRVHKNDADPFPSNPHAHNVEDGYKLHLGNGELFDAGTKKSVGKIDRKHLNEIREKLKGIKLPELES